VIRINLFPARRRRRLIPELGIFGAVLLVGVVLAGSYLYGTWRNNQVAAEISAINAETAALNLRVADVLLLESKIEDLRGREALLQTLEARAMPWADLLTDLAERTPHDVWLVNASASMVTGTTLTLQGNALSFNAVADFMRSLGESPFYSGVSLGTAQDAGEQAQAVQFGLVLTLRPRTVVPQPDVQGAAR